MSYRLMVFLIFVLLSLLPIERVTAADEGWQSVGVRMGISATKKNAYFHQYEVFTQYGLPWHWRAESGWGVTLQINAAAGDLHGAGTDSFIASFGPGLTIDKNGRGFALDIGPDVNYLDRKRFGSHNFGSHYLFDAHGSISYIFRNGLGIGYRFQHMSNAGFNETNTGLDLNMATLSWHF